MSRFSGYGGNGFAMKLPVTGDRKRHDAEGKSYPEFDRYASAYDELLADPARERFARDPLYFHKRKWMLMQRLLKRAGVEARALRWLDVGCGRGELLRLAGGNFARSEGCDPSVAMLSACEPFKVYQQISSADLPFETASVDFVTAICVFHHVHGEARARLVGETRRVLKPGGLCCVIEHNPWNPVTRAIVRRCPVDTDAELLTPRVARSLLRDAGFSSFTTDYFLLLPERLFERWGLVESAFAGIPLGGQYALLGRASS
ncbi:MAG: class I SAM-dependent methyltransferase [Acidobacteria bacterium]|nr:class I SAM-dependent methyltransferase [Acidobacteriota bacterium]